MALSSGTRVGPYEILCALGAGGMGEVYRASDTKLKRHVAIKVLRPELTTDRDRLARFQREAEVLASINHPNIAGIYSVEDAEGSTALVLELVEGPTLADRIETGPIPLDEAVPIATQIVDALEAAHEKGIIHRDLKPANIKVRPDGAVKVLDFGLAKAVEPAPTSNLQITAAQTVSPAMMTGVGVIVGTAAYMSPEQAKGQAADARSDIWAFGCVAYEMLTGTRPFAGEGVAETLAAVLRADPDWTALPANTTQGMRRLLMRCLQKDRRRRLAAIADARLELEDAQSPALTPRAQSSRVAWVVAGAAIIAAIASVGYATRRPSEERRATDAVQFTIAAPENESFGGPSAGGTGDATQVAISPDGRHIAFVAGAQGRFRIWLRPIASASATPMHGTDGGTFPFWSPDSRAIAFFADGKLKKVQIMGGPPVVLCDAPGGRGGTWNRDDIILFTPSGAAGGLQRVSSAGGTPVGVTTLDPSNGETNHRWPHFLPDGRHFFYTASTGTCCPPPKPAVVRLASLDPGEPTVTLMQAESAVFYSVGHLFFARDGTLMAQRFDAETRALKGDAFPVAEDISFEGSRYVGAAASASGTLVYGQTGPQASPRLTWFDRAGRALEGLGDLAAYQGVALSPNERRIAVALRSGTSNLDLWLLNAATGSRSRLTTNAGFDTSAVWAPDGTRIAFVSERAGTVSLRQISTDGTVDDSLLESSDIVSVTSWSSDGRFIAFTRRAPTGNDVWALPMFGNRQPFPLAQSEFNETLAAFSPNGRWIALTTNETGLGNVFVQAFPGPGERHQVSTDGGSHPVWRADGMELYYLARNGSLMAVPIHSADRFEPGIPQALFAAGAPRFSTTQVYAATRDGRRFLVNARPPQSNSAPLTIVVNWKAALRN